ncbi:phosphate-transporting ATPase [Tistlia consotensis]|uniref:Phosphate-transporting ATPase n=1 Tax=Tistlia consotensis USBA 355 TaxID=560819 RepID=A0A1Y6CC57_9PROT|nr:ATP-binding cassette domain-containing protein [Tistlia consotensis]SMF54152.1 phosphate-transporting ATPase [Tistlia consotensis USBA 355]SNR86625.1 phosphate-transporting ATPase [Tistlia consotensis]
MLTVEGLTAANLGPIDLSLGDREILALRGPSGAGKSLLLRALVDLDPSEGRVALDGVERAALPAPDWRRRVAYLPAESGWWADRVGEHFARPEEARPEIEALGLPGESLDWAVARLSTGEKQRLALVRALQQEPKVLLLDEPTSALDPEARDAVEALIRRQREAGRAILLVSHDHSQAERLADRVLEIEKGRLVGPAPGAAPGAEPRR